MMNFLKNHPFAVEAFFESSVVLTFAVPKNELQKMIPDCLELDTFQDKWAFIAVAMVQTSGLRPKGFPEILGNDFFLIGYRIFVRYTNKAGKKLRGLFILKTETDTKKMEFLGNIFTHYNYTTTDIQQITDQFTRRIQSAQSNFEIAIEHIVDEVQIPQDSPFTDWKDARRFAGPLPFTFTFLEKEKSVLIIEGVRQNWKPQAIKVRDYHFQVLDNFKFSEAILASAFEIKDVPYFWKKGKIERWK